MNTANPLTGLFPTGRELCDYSKTEGYAIPPAPEGTVTSLARRLREEAMNHG